MTKKERGNFGSKLGVILASAGSAVGLGIQRHIFNLFNCSFHNIRKTPFHNKSADMSVDSDLLYKVPGKCAIA